MIEGSLFYLNLLQVEENLGMSMVFTIVAAVIEKLNEYFDENTTNREEEKERVLRKAEEADRVSHSVVWILPL